MYSVVMLMALQGGGMDIPEFGRRRGGCHGCYGGCYGGYGGCWGGGYGGCWGGGYGGCWGGGYGGCWGSTYAVMPYTGGYPASGGAGYRARYYMPDSGAYYPGGVGQPYYDGGRGDRTREMRQEEGGAVDRSRGTTTPDRRGTTPDRGTTTPDRGTTPPAPGDRSREQPREQQGRLDAPATLVVQLPADARLTVDGAPTRSMSDTRAFITPPLPGGRDFHYTLEAQLTRNGKTSTVSREVTVRAGEETQVRIEFPQGTVAQR